MVKKRLASGQPCDKCAQAEEMLKRRGLWGQIDEVLWAVEGESHSPGAKVAARHGVKLAPFFVLLDESGEETVVTSALRLVRQHLDSAPVVEPPRADAFDPVAAAKQLEGAEPAEILRFGLTHFGERCAIAFSGAEDVALVDMASRLGLPFSVFTIDTGRLRGETCEFLDEVRRRYGIAMEIVFPDAAEVSSLVTRKGPNSFYRDGHGECCATRKLRPLERVLGRFDAWVTGHRSDPRASRELPAVEVDPIFRGSSERLVRLNPLARWSRVDVFDYLRRHEVPTNPLHERGFARVGCTPCTRAVSAGAPNRWWWEDQAGEPPGADPGGGI